MQEWQPASDMFFNHEADLLHALSSNYKSRPFIQTKKYINYYNVCAVRHVNTPPFPGLMSLQRGIRIGVRKDDYAAVLIHELDTIPFDVQYMSPKEGLTRVRARQCDYYLWGTIPLENKIQELALDSLVLDELEGVPAGELHIVGYCSASTTSGSIRNVFTTMPLRWLHLS